MDEALEAKVIEALPAAVGRYQFGHGLIRQALYEKMSSIRRLRAHASIGEALERMHQTELAAHAAELARHFAEAESVMGPGKLARYSLMAGEQALAASAYEDAIAQFERGLVARDITLSGTEAASDEEAAALLFGLARAQAATFERVQFEEAFITNSRAFEYYAETGNVALAVAVAEFPIGAPGVHIPGGAELIERALALVPADSHEAGRLLARYGGLDGVIFVKDADGSLRREQALGRALIIAQREGDIALEIRTLLYTGRLARRNFRHREGLEILLQAADLARRNNDLHSEVVTCYWAALAQSNVGDLEGMRLTAGAGLDAAERLNDRSWLALALWNSQMAAKLEGSWQTARDKGDRGLTVSPRECRILYTSVLEEYEVGDFSQAGAYLEKFLDAMHQTGPGFNAEYAFASCLIPMIACITGKSERLDVAETAAKPFFHHGRPVAVANLVSSPKPAWG